VTNEQNMLTNEQEKHLIELRRSQVYELHAKGYSNTEISNMLSEHVSEPTVSRDLTFLRRQAKEKIRNFIDEDLPNEYNKTLVGLNAILKEAWTASRNATGKDKIQALELAQKAYQMKLELLASATVVQSAVKFVEDIKNKQQPQESEHEDFQNDEEPTPIEPEEDLGEQ
jgi:transposase